MDGREADIGDLIEFTQRIHDIGADGGALNFFFVLAPLLLQIREHLINLLLCHRAFCAREPDAALQLATAVGLAGTVALHNDQRRQFLTLEGGIPVLTLAALAAPADGPAFLSEARVDHGRVFVLATGAAHGKMIHDVDAIIEWRIVQT